MEQEKVLMAKVVKEDPANKVYLICLRTDSGDFWDIIEGREAAWDYIKDKCIYNNVNVLESFVLVDSLILRKRKSVYDFMKYSEQFIQDPDGFDIEDYISGDVIESTESVEDPRYSNSPIKFGELEVENGTVTNIVRDMMDGNINTQDLK